MRPQAPVSPVTREDRPMSAIPEDFIRTTARLSEEVTRPFPSARKVYVEGSRPDIRVPMREVRQTPTVTSSGLEENPPVYVYDTSGPFTDPAVRVDLLEGVPEVRTRWIEERADTEVLPGPTSDFGRRRQADPALASLRFAHIRPPRRARAGRNVTADALCPAGDRHSGDGVRRDPREPQAGRAAGRPALCEAPPSAPRRALRRAACPT